MPTYDYRCDACEHSWEQFQSITAEPEKKCPACGKKKARRIIGPGGGFIFKGSGFYLTDYRSESYKEGAKADSKPAASTESSKSESKSESAPAPKADAKPSASAKSAKSKD
ncbi:MAG: zinc ribbon domain-containing protein [Planctomycetaceae bacterium]|nr:zinc ribbon domain-containing protein [Planctomycetaceae bacterium]